MKPLLIASVLSLAFAGAGVAQERPASDPVLGERLIEGVATRERLWIRNDKGAVVAFDRRTGERRLVAEGGVVDLLRADGRTVGLKASSEPARLAVVDLESGASLAPPVEAVGGSLLRSDRGWIVLTPGALLETDGREWRRRPIRDEARHFGVMTAATTPDGSIYIGYNQGEWGGGLWRIAPGSEGPAEVRRIDGGEECDGPLGAACQPVTGVIPDASGDDCVLVSTGLSHLLSHGSVLRVCGERVEIVFEELVPQPPGSLGAGVNKWPMFGLAAARDGWIAVSQGKLFVERNGEVRATDLPRVEEWRGLGLAEADGVLILRTDVNWGMSLSGYTPLLVPVTD